jgi:hypothetical protein
MGQRKKDEIPQGVEREEGTGNGHFGQAKRNPESWVFRRSWIPTPAPDPDPGFAGMTE